jgi:mRNA interferase HigB
MKIVGKDSLEAFKADHADARADVDSWVATVEDVTWRTPHEMKMSFPKADPVGGGNTIFNIYYNRYRLWVIINYKYQLVMVKAIGTHKEYEKWKIK